jgi:hypothetical protein
VFLFVDMAAFNILYCILFFYIFMKLKSFQITTPIAKPSIDEPQQWSTNLQAGSEKPLPALPPAMDLPSPATFSSQGTDEDQTQERTKEEALKLLIYPLLFTCFAMPFAVARVAQLAGDKWSFLAIDIGACFYCSSGWVNVVVYVAIRKGLVSWNWLLRKQDSEILPVAHLPMTSAQSRFTPPPTRRSTIILSEGSVVSVSAFHPPRNSCIATPSDSDPESVDWAAFIEEHRRTTDGRTIVVEQLRHSCVISPSPDSDTESFDWAEFIDEDKTLDGGIIMVERGNRWSGSEESLWFGPGTVNVLPDKDPQ